MAARERSNGEDPFPSIPLRNPVPERTPLRETFTPIEPESVTGIIARRLCDQVGALVTREDQTSADVRALGETMVKGFNELKVVMRLPPMRAESPSSDAVPLHARKSFGEFLKQRASETPGGPGVVQAPPAELEQAAQRYFEEQMAVYEANKRLKKLDDDKADKKAALERRRTFWALTVSGCIVAVVTVAGTYFVTKASEHEKGFVEGRASAPASTVVVAAAGAPTDAVVVMPQASASSVRAFAPQAPAAAAPRAPAR